MKTLFVSFAALVFAFFLGCQSSITDPVNQDNNGSSYTENFASKDWISTFPGEIKLQGMIDDPSYGINGCAQINGIVRYRIDLVDYSASRPAPHPALKVSLLVNAKIKCQNPADNNLWIVEGFSEDLIYKSNLNVVVNYLEKSFRVRNTSRGMDLVLKFRVSEKNLELVSMRLFINEY